MSQISQPLVDAFATLVFHFPAWVHRRVEDIEFDHDAVCRATSADLTVPDQYVDDLQWGSLKAVPIAMIRKRPLRSFSLRQNGSSVPLLERAQNAEIAARILIRTSELAVEQDKELTATKLSVEVEDQLRVIAAEDEEASVDALLELIEWSSDTTHMNYHLAGSILSNGISGPLIHDFATNFVLTALLPSANGRQLVKYKFEEPLVLNPAFASTKFEFINRTLEFLARGVRFMGRLVGASMIIVIECDPARTGSYHVDIKMPDELHVELASLFSRSYTDSKSLNIHSYDSRTKVAALHVDGTEVEDAPRLGLSIRADRWRLPFTALANCAVVTSILIAGTALVDRTAESGLPETKILETLSSVGPGVSILFAANALLLALSLVPSAERLTGTAVAPPRLFAGVVGVSSLAAALIISFAAATESEVVQSVWSTASWVSVIFTLLAALYVFRCGSSSDD